MTSDKKIETNRKNARRSTGPRTDKGKAVSRFNAVKHGLLARQVVARGHWMKESADEFDSLCRELHKSLGPVGPLEEMLVSQIVTASWRLRRARTAEAGEIAVNGDQHWWIRRPAPWEQGNGHKSNALFHSLGEYFRTVKGTEFVMECLAELRGIVANEGELTEAVLKKYKVYVSDPNEVVCKLEKLRDWVRKNPENLAPEVLLTRHRDEVLGYLDEKIEWCKGWLKRVQARDDAEDAARRAAAVLPSDEVVEKIMRYESALHRQLYRAMNQLERLQRRRRGEHVAAPVVVEVAQAS
jgi:hypothetical protein